MTHRAKPARYRLAAHPAIPGTLLHWPHTGQRRWPLARAALDDLAHGRATARHRPAHYPILVADRLVPASGCAAGRLERR